MHTGEPKFYLDTNKVWSKHMSDYLVIRRDVIPAYERLVFGRPYVVRTKRSSSLSSLIHLFRSSMHFRLRSCLRVRS